jgi:Tol biopolymer transport system component
MTETGMSLGTPHYMSPEQAMGEREITARTDVYALGAVTYEMLIGEPPFTGPTAQSIVAKLVTDEPRPPSQLRKTVPHYLDGVVLTALAKLPADRFATAAAFSEALRNPRFDSGFVATPVDRRRSRTTTVAVAVGLTALGAIGGVLVSTQLRPAPVASAERQQVTYSGLASAPAISADGRFVAYLETRCPEPPATGGCENLHVIEVGSARPVEILARAERLMSPRWTHDGLSLVVAGAIGGGRSGLFVIPRLGGTPRKLADAPVAFDTHAAADSAVLVITTDSGTTLRVLDLVSGALTEPFGHLTFEPFDVAWSPDARMLAMSINDEVHIFSRDGGLPLSSMERTTTRNSLRWSADGGHVLIFRWTAGQDDDLMAFPVSGDGQISSPRLMVSLVPTLLRGQFDIARGTGRVVVGSGAEFYDLWSFNVAGSSAQAARLTQGTSWYGPPYLTADGRILYYLRADALGNSLYRIAAGAEAALTADRQVVNNSLRLSRDERSVTFESRVDSAHVLVIYDVAAGTSRRVPRQEEDFGWLLPGGKEILWLAPYEKKLWISDLSGTQLRSVTNLLTGDRAELFVGRWEYGGWHLAPDGESLALLGGNVDESVLFRVPLRGGAPVQLGRFARKDGAVGLAGWSNDGVMHLALRAESSPRTTLIAIDASTGARRTAAALPEACHPGSVSFAATGRRAVCSVRERRTDVMMFDGIRP